MKNFKALFKYTYKYRYRYILGVTFLILIDILQLFPPKIIGFLTDIISKGKATPHTLMKYILYIVLIAVFVAAGRFIWRIFIVGTSRYVEYDMRNKFFSHLEKLSQNFYTENKTGDLMALATNDLNAIKMALGSGVIMMVDAIVLSIATITVMLTINVKLTLLSLIPLPFVTLIALRFGKIIHKKFLKVQQAFSKITDVVQENFSGIRIIKSFAQEEKEYIKFTEENLKNFDVNMSFIKVWGLFSPLIEFVSSLSFVLLIGFGGIFVIYNYISLGNFITFNMYLGNLIWPMMAIGWVINILTRGFASLERVENVLKQKPEIYDRNVIENASLKGDIKISNLSFKYKGSDFPVLKDINIEIKKGTTLGIIGKTGSGKSTLINLLVRLYNVEEGKIKINNNDINAIPLKTLRQNIGFVAQDPFLFSTSIAENINLPNEYMDMEKVYQSAKDADIYSNIVDFPNGFNTLIGERGVTLSGGQKQRIAISRALIKNPDILILDDCLSAVDAKTEVKILENLKRIMKERTSIIISHRISALKDSDCIIVLDDGYIVEQGTHNELLSKKGLYYDIYEKQLIEEKIQKEGEA